MELEESLRSEIALLKESDLFDASWYVEKYPDVKLAGMEPEMHYLWIGYKLLRDPSPKFHTKLYLERNAGKIAINGNPLVHFLNELLPVTSDEEKEVDRKTTRNSNEHIELPYRKKGGDPWVRSIARNGEHYWYENYATKRFVANAGKVPKLHNSISRMLFVSHDFGLTTGVSRPISHYLNAMSKVGGYDLTSIELRKNQSASVIKHEFDAHDFVIVNSISQLFSHEGMIDLVIDKGKRHSAVYLHETEWVFNKLEKLYPEKYQYFCECAPNINFMCSSVVHKQWLEKTFGAMSTLPVYYATALSKEPEKITFTSPLPENITILMVGTIQSRKGVELYSRLADRADKDGLPWKFQWIGQQVEEGLYLSSNVDFLGRIVGDELYKYFQEADVFFLSSEDDPFPLACLDALNLYKRVVVYKKTGVAELFSKISGASIYDGYTVDSAFKSIYKVIKEDIDIAAYGELVERFSLENFVGRFHRAINHFVGFNKVSHEGMCPSATRFSALVQPLDINSWNRLLKYLNNFSNCNLQLFVSTAYLISRENVYELEQVIRRSYADAVFLDKSNDITFDLVEYCNDNGLDFDFFVSFKDRAYRAYDGFDSYIEFEENVHAIYSNPTRVQQIETLFKDHANLKAVYPQFFCKTEQAEVCGQEAAGVMELASKIVEGSFWLRYEALKQKFDENRIVRQSGDKTLSSLIHTLLVEQPCAAQPINSAIGKSISALKDRHKGEDIYVIGAGASADYISPNFFDGKTVIGVNRVYKRYKCNYVIMKEYTGKKEERGLLASGAVPVASLWDSADCNSGRKKLNSVVMSDSKYYFYDHNPNRHEKIDLEPLHDSNPDKLVVSYSTITSAIHLAAHLGAKNIILLGHDCGFIDNRATYQGYYSEDITENSPWETKEEYGVWLKKIEGQTIDVKESLRRFSNIPVHSLNPFINFGLEQHVFSRSIVDEGVPPRLRVNAKDKVLLLCNGPSAREAKMPEEIDEFKIARMNFFFLEDEALASGRVDYYFWAVNNPLLHEKLNLQLKNGNYKVENFFSPVSPEIMIYPEKLVKEEPFWPEKSLFDHWSMIALRPKLARYVMSRPLPTSGVQAIACLAIMGYRKIYISGMDFYSTVPKQRYFYNIPGDIKEKLAGKDTEPGYEQGAHSLECDLGFLSLVIEEFPELEFVLLSKMPVFEEYLKKRGLITYRPG